MRAAVERQAIWICVGLVFFAPTVVAADKSAFIRLGLCHTLVDLAGDQAQVVVSHIKDRLVSAGVDVAILPPRQNGKCCDAPDCLTAADGKPLDAALAVAGSRTGPVVRLSFALFSQKEARVVYQDSQEATLAELKSLRALDEPVKDILEAVQILLAPSKVEAPPPVHPAPPAPTNRPAEKISKVAPAPPDRLWAHLSLWSGVAFVAFGGASAALAKEAADNYSASPNQQTWDRSRLWAGMMWAGFGVGAALVATGIVLWMRESPSDNATSAFIAAPAGSGGGLVLGWHGRF
jgi:hypothetical protein